MTDFYWIVEDFSPVEQQLLATVAEYYPDRLSQTGKKRIVLKKTKEPVLRTTFKKDRAVIEAGTPAAFARGLGSVLSGEKTQETVSFDSLGIMIDCSRNKVFTVDYLKRFLVRMALMGGNLAMLYTEDTYRLPGEPFFGYMRGGYSLAELQDLDRFAAGLGIELVGCIQTLGHLDQVLRHRCYEKARDTGGVLMTDAPETYELIDKMISFWSEALSSRRIHIGMDEAHDLGRGRFLDYHGYENGSDLFLRHLGKVNAVCTRHGLKPIIWSDMFFRLANPAQDYYAENLEISEAVRKKVPPEVRLCYWDYYHDNAAFYEKSIQRHRAFGSEPLVASGIWTWGNFWCSIGKTRETAVPCINACRQTGIRELFFTMWGDDGGYCLYDSALAALELCCGVAYGALPDNDALYSRRFRALCGEDYRLYEAAATLQLCSANCILWDDPLQGTVLLGCEYRKILPDYCKKLERLLTDLNRRPVLSGQLQTVRVLAALLLSKIRLRKALLAAYSRGDRDALRNLAEEVIPGILYRIGEFDELFRADWLETAKPFGLEVIQRRNAGLVARYRELRRVLLEFLDGTLPQIAELDASLEAAPAVRETGFTPDNIYSGSYWL